MRLFVAIDINDINIEKLQHLLLKNSILILNMLNLLKKIIYI